LQLFTYFCINHSYWIILKPVLCGKNKSLNFFFFDKNKS
jgi:hypothetical protein